MGGDLWTDDYTTRPIGVLEAPSILVRSSSVPPESEDVKIADSGLGRRESDGWVVIKPQEL